MIAAFARVAERVLAHLGEGALLRGEPTLHKVNVDRNVELVDRQGNVYIAQVVLLFNVADAPLPNDRVDLLSNDVIVESFILDTMMENTGYTTKFIARSTPVL